MSKVRNNHLQNTAKCVCSKCRVEAHSTVGKPHRKCSSAKGQENPGQYRGIWEKA